MSPDAQRAALLGVRAGRIESEVTVCCRHGIIDDSDPEGLCSHRKGCDHEPKLWAGHTVEDEIAFLRQFDRALYAVATGMRQATRHARRAS